MNTAVNQFDSAKISSTLRYERVAMLEAVLTLKEKQKRASTIKWACTVVLLLTGLCVGIATM